MADWLGLIGLVSANGAGLVAYALRIERRLTDIERILVERTSTGATLRAVPTSRGRA